MRLLIACMLLMPITVLAQGTAVDDVRLWAAPDHTRVVFDVAGPVKHRVFRLDDPHRVVIDLTDATLHSSVKNLQLKGDLIRDIRSARRHKNDLRVVLDMAKRVRPKSFQLKPNEQYGHRLVVDLYDPAEQGHGPVKTADQRSDGKQALVIAIDAGHGGEDPGAHGPRGTLEKDVVLEIARRFEALVRDEPGMRPVMIRDGDYYISLRERIAKARAHEADLFVSIHADAFRDPRAHGSSVYVLSRKGATTEAARWLAEQENAADLVGGVSLKDKDSLLAEVLLDLSQSATIERSLNVADYVLDELSRVGEVHKEQVEQAGFVVLKSPDIPSLLVETAFISNPAEERKLRTAGHQRQLARAMLRGTRQYLRHTAPENTLFAGREHTIRRGETLSSIARRYDVSLHRLRAANDIHGDLIRTGETLRIPGRSGS